MIFKCLLNTYAMWDNNIIVLMLSVKKILTVLPIVCFGPTVISNLPPPGSFRLILCLTYIGIATILCDPIWYERRRKLPSGGMKESILSD